jgi:DNA ligase D-like protein (predicted ligase)
MLATRVPELRVGSQWQYEVKWDGYRIEAIKDGANVHLFSRRGASYTDKFKSVTKAVQKIQATTATLDGEVVAIDPIGQPSFQVLQNRGKLPAGYRLVFYAFDLLFLNGKDLKRLPWIERRALMPAILEGSGVLFSSVLPGTLPQILKAVRKHNLEGVVAKRTDSVYEPGRRSIAWQKLPLKSKQDFVIGGYRPEASTLELILVGYYEKGKFLFAGKVRMGLNPALRKKLLALLKPLSTGKCPFSNLPTSRHGHWGEGITADEMNDYIWLKPTTVAEIKFTEWTTGDVLRHPEFVALRDDKSPAAVTRES